MKTAHDWTHMVLQRLIIIFLGLLTIGAFFQSCTPQHATCSAYDQVTIEEKK